jgi:DNA-directed RNA polymerase specialized sigma subunit
MMEANKDNFVLEVMRNHSIKELRDFQQFLSDIVDAVLMQRENTYFQNVDFAPKSDRQRKRAEKRRIKDGIQVQDVMLHREKLIADLKKRIGPGLYYFVLQSYYITGLSQDEISVHTEVPQSNISRCCVQFSKTWNQVKDYREVA